MYDSMPIETLENRSAQEIIDLQKKTHSKTLPVKENEK